MPSEHPTPKLFTLDEALEIFPLVKELTERAVVAATVVEAQLLALKGETPRRAEFETAYTDIVRQWAQDAMQLGCEVKGLWLVDFDNGEGYYCWKYPEDYLEYFHDYTSGFSGRTKIV
jgi:hypothetical protein